MKATHNSDQHSDEAILWQMVELMMNVGTDLFKPSQGVETGISVISNSLGIREEIVNLVLTEFDQQSQELEQTEDAKSSTDDTSNKIFSDIRQGKAPVAMLLQELLKNKQFISEDLNGLVLVLSSLFLNKFEYENMVHAYITKALAPTDTLYTLLMISINKAQLLESSNLLHNWPMTFGMVILSLLNSANAQSTAQEQVMIYLDKLGSALFTDQRSAKENWLGLFFIFVAKQQPLYVFLDKHAKNGWRVDLNINLLCTIDNLFYEEDADAYEVTMLKLAFYRGYLCYQAGKQYYETALKFLNEVIKKKRYLGMYKCESTVNDAVMVKDKIMKVLNYENKQIVPEEKKQQFSGKGFRNHMK